MADENQGWDELNQDVFTPPDTDLSVDLLSRILGEGWQGYIAGNTAEPGTASVLFELTGAFNLVVLAGVCAVMVYIIGVGTVGTAHEGKALGERYSTLWTPIRSAFSVAMLSPLPWVQLSLLQAILLSLTYASIGGADFLWGKAVDVMEENGGQLVQPATPSQDTRGLAKYILQVETLQHYYAHQMDAAPPTGGKWTWVDETGYRDPAEDNWGAGDTAANINPGRWMWEWTPGPDTVSATALGSITIGCTDKDSRLCNAKKGAVNQMISALYPVAEGIALQYDGSPNETPTLDRGAYRVATRAYDAAINRVKIDVTTGENDTYQKQLSAFADRSKDLGWISAGWWYWTLTGFQEHNAGKFREIPQVNPAQWDRIETHAYGNLRDYINAVDAYADVADTETLDAARGRAHSDGIWGKVTAWFSKPFTAMKSATVLAEGDPIANMQGLGHTILGGGYAIVGSYIAFRSMVAGTDEGAEGWNDSFWGGAASFFTGGLSNAGSEALTGAARAAAQAIGPLLWFLVIPLFIAGLSLAFYLPAVPFVLWTMATIGWFIRLFEALVAAPIWAAAHGISGEGDGLAGQHGKQGYMLALQILFYVPLMLIGLFISIGMMYPVGYLTSQGFQVFTTAMQAGYSSGLFANFALMLLISAVLVTITHKVFSLITWMPSNLLRWIGQQVENLGEREDEGQIKGAVVGGFSKSESAGQQTASKMVQQNTDYDESSSGSRGEGTGGEGSATGQAGGTEQTALGQSAERKGPTDKDDGRNEGV